MLGDLENQERNHRNIQGLHYAFINSGNLIAQRSRVTARTQWCDQISGRRINLRLIALTISAEPGAEEV
jgi:hypothetical protein